MKIKLLELAMVSMILACNNGGQTPKPTGYPRIDLPDAVYQKSNIDCPYTFEINEISRLNFANEQEQECWLNIDYPLYKCRIHLSYKAIDNDLGRLVEEARTLVYKHTIKASAINERTILDTNKKVYSRIYELEGDAASSVQFVCTDSNMHFLRGALYFNARTNADSLYPAIEYLRKDIDHLIKSFEWQSL